jgi:hypothetical protein
MEKVGMIGIGAMGRALLERSKTERISFSEGDSFYFRLDQLASVKRSPTTSSDATMTNIHK